MKPAEKHSLRAELVDKTVAAWKAGQAVAMPTETVYGLAADASNGAAVARIYALKSRPQFNPLIVHVADAAMAERYVVWNDLADKLAYAYWPGPLTLVLKRRANCSISELVSAGGDTLAVRAPAHPVTRQLIAAFNGGLAAPSANRSGRVSPTTAAHVRSEFGDAVAVVDGGACEVGIESTVVDCTGEKPVLLRPGSITRAMIEKVAGPIGGASHGGILLSPGQMESHYAPSIAVRLNATEVRQGEALLAFGAALGGAIATQNLSPSGDLIEAAANLFAHLRALDDPAHRAIAVMPIPNEGIGEAINDRLRRAAA